MEFIQSHGMIITGAILFIAYVFIASEKIQKSVVALAGAALVMLLGVSTFGGEAGDGKVLKGVFE